MRGSAKNKSAAVFFRSEQKKAIALVSTTLIWDYRQMCRWIFLSQRHNTTYFIWGDSYRALSIGAYEISLKIPARDRGRIDPIREMVMEVIGRDSQEESHEESYNFHLRTRHL